MFGMMIKGVELIKGEKNGQVFSIALGFLQLEKWIFIFLCDSNFEVNKKKINFMWFNDSRAGEHCTPVEHQPFYDSLRLKSLGTAIT